MFSILPEFPLLSPFQSFQGLFSTTCQKRPNEKVVGSRLHVMCEADHFFDLWGEERDGGEGKGEGESVKRIEEREEEREKEIEKEMEKREKEREEVTIEGGGGNVLCEKCGEHESLSHFRNIPICWVCFRQNFVARSLSSLSFFFLKHF